MQVYFDNAATSFPKPESVYTTAEHVMRHVGANPGRAGHKMAIDASRYIYDARVELAELFNAEDEKNIIFTGNTTDSLNLGIKGLLKSGDHAITTSMEHNSVIRPLHKLTHSGVTYTQVQCSDKGDLDPSDLEKAITKDTKLIVITHASNICGTIIDIEAVGEIARGHGITFMVDAAQTAGVLDIDVQKLKIDMLATAGHKSLFGLQGTAVLYIRDGIEINTAKEGGTGSYSEALDQPEDLPDKFESGTLNTPGIAALGAGVKFIREITTKKIREHEQQLLARTLDGMKKIDGVTLYGHSDPRKQTSVVSFNVDHLTCSEVGHLLDSEFGIMVRVGVHCSPAGHKTLGTYPHGTVRASLGYFNSADEVDYFIRSLTKIAGKR